MKYETCEPTLEGYKLMLRMMKEQKKPSEETKKTMAQLERYIKQEDAKN